MMFEFIKRTATGKIALAMTVCFIIELIFLLISPPLYIKFIETFGLNSTINDVYDIILLPIRLISNLFLHFGIFHFLFNLIAFLSFAPLVEAMVGEREFLKIYFGSGIAGGILYIIVCNLFGINSIAVGASGAIAGLLGYLSIVKPDIMVIFFVFPINIVYATLLFIIISLFFIITGNPGAYNIAHAAHLGGVLFGIYCGFKEIEKRICKF